MLTLVADVLAYDLALEMCERLSSMVEAEEFTRPICLRSLALSLKARSWRKDMVVFARQEQRKWSCVNGGEN